MYITGFGRAAAVFGKMRAAVVGIITAGCYANGIFLSGE